MLYNGPCFKTYRQITKSLSIFLFLILSACLPQTIDQNETVDTTPSFSEATNVQTETPNLTLTGATPEPIGTNDNQIATPIPNTATVATLLPTAVPTITLQMIPAVNPPHILFNEIQNLDIITHTFTVEGISGIQYSFLPGYLIGVLPNDDLLLYGEGNSLLTMSLNNLTAYSLVENIRQPVFSPINSNRLIFPMDDPSKIYPIWSIELDGSEPVMLGTTTGYFPFLSVTADGKVLVLEDGHLVMKWLADGRLQARPLNVLESKLSLNWMNYDLTLGPDSSNWETPWIDFEISPDGQKIAIFDGKQGKLWLATIDGAYIKEVPLDPIILETLSKDEWPYVTLLAWSPDSRSLAYQEGIWRRTPGIIHQQIKIVGMEDQPPVRITSISDGVGSVLAWSQDSQHIAFSFTTYATLNERQRGADLFVANPAGSQPQKVSEAFHSSPSSLFWLSDSHTLLYRCWNGNRFDICKLVIR